MIDPMVLSSAVLALVVTPMMGPALQQGQNVTRAAAAEGVPNLSGFSVVLVVAEKQRSTEKAASPDLPEGAAKALHELSEFLPYKHFRVLDLQWVSCCSLTRTSYLAGRLEAGTGIPTANGSPTLLRGYHFKLSVSPYSTSVPVRFVLTAEEPGALGGDDSKLRELERERQDIQAEIGLLEDQIQNVQKRIDGGAVSSAELPPLRNRRESLRRKLTDVDVTIEEARTGAVGRPIIDSSFTMAAGETVVVGTSKLGGDKALIALVTAVRKNAASRNP